MKARLFILLQKLIPQHLLSRLVGFFTRHEGPLKNPIIRGFIHVFGVDMSEARQPDATAYASFNAFFTRELKAGTRPLQGDEQTIISPVDGSISAMGAIDHQTIFQAKGQDYTIAGLLADSPHQVAFEGGYFATIYLAPKDYHRIHAPLAGTLLESCYVPGRLFSVNPTTVAHVPNLFANNERLVCIFRTEAGLMALVMVGAMLVAGIRSSWHTGPYRPGTFLRDTLPDAPHFQRGDELGMFELGSTVILLFERDRVSWSPERRDGSSVRLGQALATWPAR